MRVEWFSVLKTASAQVQITQFSTLWILRCFLWHTSLPPLISEYILMFMYLVDNQIYYGLSNKYNISDISPSNTTTRRSYYPYRKLILNKIPPKWLKSNGWRKKEERKSVLTMVSYACKRHNGHRGKVQLLTQCLAFHPHRW